MPKRKKTTNSSTLQTSVVKTTLVSLLSKPARSKHVRNILDVYLRQVNQLRSLTSIAIKKFCIPLLASDEPFTYQLDQNFYCKVFSILSNATIHSPQQYSFLPELKAVVREITDTFQWQFNPLDGLFPQCRAVFSSQGTIMGNQFVSNWHTHVATRLESTLNVWVKNHIRAHLSDDELKDEAKARSALRRNLGADYANYESFWGEATQQRYNQFKSSIASWYQLKKASSKKLAPVVNPLKPKRKRQKTSSKPSLESRDMDMNEEEKVRIFLVHFLVVAIVLSLQHLGSRDQDT